MWRECVRVTLEVHIQHVRVASDVVELCKEAEIVKNERH